MSLPVPYVVPLFETFGPPVSEFCVEVTRKGPRIAYTFPTPADRDEYGNLWGRAYENRDVPNVSFESMHPDRQRQCMRDMLCQVCAKPADKNAEGWLFLDWPRDDSPKRWPERSVTAMPPLCVPCAETSLTHCPHLRQDGTVVLRVRKPLLCGVSGSVWQINTHGEWEEISNRDIYAPFSKPRLPGLIATRLYRMLLGVTVTDRP
ncbi:MULTISPECIES: hypothetical protein [Streptomyces]|uniref:hypothetical protein n=1 Tax=Streptomyces TaxID=1883 RepID=UPI00068A82E0|nr:MULTISPECIES: hypothetical protein [Streptomyces]RZE84494.1 hypothetical protein C0Q99_01580 [Streptomyces albidoflavus]